MALQGAVAFPAPVLDVARSQGILPPVPTRSVPQSARSSSKFVVAGVSGAVAAVLPSRRRPERVSPQLTAVRWASEPTLEDGIAASSLRSEGPGKVGERFVWEWRPQVEIHFERVGPLGVEEPPFRPAPSSARRQGFAVVMVHGFGAEGAYYDEQLRAVSQMGGAAYAMDLLGQGRSWPSADPAPSNLDLGEGPTEWGWGEQLSGSFPDGLSFGEPAWISQLQAFLHSVVAEERVYLMGNSLGGYVSAKVAALEGEKDKSRRRISGLVLANASPFWGWTSEGGFMPWDGLLPAPGWVRPIASAWFGSLRTNIGPMLRTVYAAAGDARVDARLQALAQRISDAASHPMGSAAFASILFSPKQEPSFGDALDQLAARRLPVVLIYGEDDPWVVPFWAKRAAARVEGVGEYYALSPAGHCPHHEVPAAFNRTLISWLKRVEGDETAPPPLAVGASDRGPAHEGDPMPVIPSRLAMVSETGLLLDGDEVTEGNLMASLSQFIRAALQGGSETTPVVDGCLQVRTERRL